MLILDRGYRLGRIGLHFTAFSFGLDPGLRFLLGLESGNDEGERVAVSA